jgi:hypothetical protein
LVSLLRGSLAIFAALLISSTALPTYASSGGPTVVDLSQEPQAAEDSADNVSEDTQRYGLFMKGDNVRAEIRINDVPVFFKILRNDEAFDTTFNEWIKRGLNVIDIKMERFDDKRPYNVNYSIYYQSPTQIVNGDRTMLAQSREEVLLPLRQPIGIRTQSVPALRIWQSESVELTEEEKQRLTETINSLRSRMIDALVKSDNTFLATYEKPLRDQVDIAYGRIPEGDDEILERRKELVAQFEKLFNAAVVPSPELVPADLTFEPVGDNKLVRVTRTSGLPLIEVKRGDLVFKVERPIYGSIGGIWERMR